MKYVRIMLAAIGLIAVGGASHAAQDTTLYTSATHAGKFNCNVVNVSEKPLTITIAIVDGFANPPNVLNKLTAVAQTAMPGAEVFADFGDATTGSSEAYCVIQVSGTHDRNDVRAALNTALARTFKLPNDPTNFNYPTFVFKVFEAH
jgi:hypothetical protein